jgi:aldehyde dehydrogenase (NAD+)
VLENTKENFNKNTTRDIEWRQGQLRAMLAGINEWKAEIQEALFKDLGRSPNATYVTEILAIILSIEHDLKHIKTYMKFVDEETEMLLFPGKT